MSATPHTADVAGIVRDAYGLESYDLPVDPIGNDGTQAIFHRTVEILAARAEDRIRRGLYRRYVERVEDLMFVREPRRTGTAIERLFRQDNYLRCSFDSNQAQLEDNLILLWALVLALRTRLPGEALVARVREVCATLAGTLPLDDATAAAVFNRFYGRLEKDDRPLHGLCRFLIEHVAADTTADAPALAFRIDMAALYRACVVRWLKSVQDASRTVVARYAVRAVRGGGARAVATLSIATRGRAEPPLLVRPVYHASDAAERMLRELAAHAGDIGATSAVIVHPSSWRPDVAGADVGVPVRAAAFDFADRHTPDPASVLVRLGLAGNAGAQSSGRLVRGARC